MFSLADILRARIGHHVTVSSRGDAGGLSVYFSKGAHTLSNVGVDVIETTSPTGEKFYYSIRYIVEVRS